MLPVLQMKILTILFVLLLVAVIFTDAKGRRGKGKGKGKDKKDCKGHKCKDEKSGNQGRTGEIQYVVPFGGMRVRLSGPDRNGSSGNVEVFLRNQWGMICDDEWGISDANVVCQQLGFQRGAVAETRESYFGEGNWNSSDILMDDVNCNGDETELQRCNYKYPSNCNPTEGAGVVCQPNLGCPAKWTAGPDGCYLLPNLTTTQRVFAVNKCKKFGGHLVNIESEAENHFLSMMLSDFSGEGILTGGLKTRNGWMWEKITVSQSNNPLDTSVFGDLSDFLRIRRSPRSNRRRHSKRGRSGYSGRSQTSVESTVRRSIQYFKWFPGWLPGRHNAEPTNKRNDKCLYLKNTFQHPRSQGFVNVNYLFWDDEFCKRTKRKFRKGFHYLCERPRQEVAIPTTESPATQEGCYVGNGVTYRGTVSRTDKGTRCINWTLSNRHTPTNFPDSGLEQNYCRNPDNDVRPWCYIDNEGTYNFCPIPQCTEEPDLGQQTTREPTTTRAPATTTELPVRECPDDQFYCSHSAKCIAQQWRCDLEPDCLQDEDENGCVYKIELFNKLPGRMLENPVIKETFRGISNETCAKFCLSRTGYVCRSFSFNRQLRKCLLSDTNTQTSGVPPEMEGYDTFELMSQTSDCDGMYTCSNGRCIETLHVCDGIDDCGDLTDEEDCGTSNPIEVRLSGGGEHSGRVEIKYLGEWGVVCDDNWDVRDATVVCRMLGFNRGTPKAESHSKFGSGNAKFFLDEVDCNGTESSLEECSHPGWKVHDCRSHEVAGVTCGADKSCEGHQYACPSGTCIPARAVCDQGCDCLPNCEDEKGNGKFNCESGTMELVNGSVPNSGRVELIRNGLRGTVCDDAWDDKDATVVCKMLGFRYGKAAVGSQFGPGKGPIWLDGVECDGTEVSLTNCGHASWGIHDCSHSEDAGVFCSNTEGELTPSVVDIRVELVDGQHSKEGRVELIRDGVRGTICDDQWSDEDAQVVCRMLGHSGGTAHREGYFGPGQDTLPIWMDEVSCSGSEQSLKDCSHPGWGTHDCAHGEDAGVSCATAGPETSTSSGTDHEIPGFSRTCGRRPLEANNERVKREEPGFEEREVLDAPKFERIIGGFTASRGFYPWQAGIRRLIQYPDIFGHFCGGTILSEYWILTAAHCYVDVLKDHLRVRTGDHDNKVADDFEQEFEVEELISHRLYDEDTFDYDIALIKIKPVDGDGIKFSDHVQPACLPNVATLYETGKKCHVSGWGRTESGYQNLLKSARVPLLSDRTCRNLYKDITRNMFCAGYLEGGIDTCAGDSGGPLVCELDGVYTIMGATSYGHGCAEANAPGVYARVKEFLPWIKEVVIRYT